MNRVLKKAVNFARLVLPLAFLQLTGCASQMGNDFQCPNKGIVMCKRLDEVNALVDRGAFNVAAHPKQKTSARQAQAVHIWVAPQDKVKTS